MKDSWVLAGLSALAALFMFSLAWTHRARVFTGNNDFVAFYSGGRLAGTPYLYNRERIRQVQLERVGVTGEAWRFIRLPYYAAVFWPLAQLPYEAAYLIWQALSLGAAVTFVWLWGASPRGVTALFTCLSLPLATSFMNGQDLAWLLLWIALAMRWHGEQQPFRAGAVLALCASKYHLFLLLPLWILARREWRVAAGLGAGGAALVAASFLVGGPGWPIEYYEVLRDPSIHPLTASMPNLHGALSFFPALGRLEWPAAAAVAAAVWVVCRYGTAESGLAAVLAGGLLAGYHAYLPDCAVLLPAMLVALGRSAWKVSRIGAMALLTPVPYFLVPLQTPWLAVVPGLALAVLAALAAESYASRGRSSRYSPAG